MRVLCGDGEFENGHVRSWMWSGLFIITQMYFSPPEFYLNNDGIGSKIRVSERLRASAILCVDYSKDLTKKKQKM